MKQWIRFAFAGAVVRRGLKYALVVGAVLALINHGDAIFAGKLTARDYGKIVLTMLVPYCVSVLSSVGTILDLGARARELIAHAVEQRP